MSVLETLRRVNAPPPPEDSVALRVAVLVAVMAGAIAVLDEGVGDTPLRAAVLVGIPGGFVYSHLNRRRPSFWLKVSLAAGLLVAFGQFVASVSRIQANSVADVQIPLAELFLWVQLLHSADVPARRDLQFSLASSLTLVAVAGVLSISLAFASKLLIWAVAAIVGLVLSHRSELAQLRPLSGGQRDRGPEFASIAWTTGTAVGLVAVLATVVFMIAPAAGTSRAFTFPNELPRALAVPLPGGLSNPSLGGQDPSRRGEADASPRQTFGYFGFSDELDTSVRGRPDDTLMMRVRASAADFWRGQTFDVWDGRVWRLSDDEVKAIRGINPIDIPATLGDFPFGDELIQTFYVEEQGPNLVFGAYRISQVYFPESALFQLSDGTLRAAVELEKGAVYTVISSRRAVTEEILRRADFGRVPAEVLARYTQLPSVPDRVLQLARDVTADAPTTYDKARAIEAWMAANTTYSLDIPSLPEGADAVDQFLFVDRQGFCEQIGSSLVVMLRSLGVPARLAVGYTPGERNPFTGLYEVRARDAHSWAEVYFPGVGWQGFDPTALVPLSGDSEARSAGSGLFSFLGRHLPRPPVWLIQGGTVVLVTGVIVVAAGLFVGMWRNRRRRSRDRTWADIWILRLETAGAARGRPRRPSETVPEYVSILRRSVLPDPRLSDVASALDAEQFSGLALPGESRAHVEGVLRELTPR